MHSQLKVIKSKLSKGKSSNKVSHAADELQFLMDFNSSITQSMAKTLEHLTDFVFVTVANTTLARRDSYMSHLKMGIIGCFTNRTSSGTVQEVSEISCRGTDIPVQGSTLWSVHSIHGIYCGSKRGETDGHTQGYKNPPVPRRLVGESQIPPNLSPAYPDSNETVSRFRLADECRKIGAGTQTSL